MNLTYIVLAHDDPRHLSRQISSLFCHHVRFVIHLDISANIDDFTSLFCPLDLEKISFIKDRCLSNWGSFEIIQAMLNSLRFVYKKMSSTDRVIFLSGHDYPIKNNKYIYSYLKANPLAIYLNFNEVPYNIWRDGGVTRFPYYEKISKFIKIYAGSQWFSLPMYAVQIMFDFLKNNSGFIEYFRKVTIPDESFFQTLFLNCGEEIIKENLINRNLHLIKWDYPYMHPRYFDEKHFKLLRRTPFLFARKFASAHSSKILDKIETELLSRRKTIKTPIDNLSQDQKKNKSAVLFLTNKGDKKTIHAYKLLKTNASDSLDIHFVYHKTRKKISKLVSMQDPIVFDNSILTNLKFKGIHDKLVPGSNHFPLFQYYQNNPNYDYYWCIEDDVRFNGEWSMFFESLSKRKPNTDFLSCHIRNYEDEPNWHWWETLKHSSGERIPLQMRLRSFNPIFRISNRALSYLRDLFLSGWSGHHEVTIPTLLNLGGYIINDFGGHGSYVLPDCNDRFYKSASPDPYGFVRSGSMRFRPFIDPLEMQENILYHPVKVSKLKGKAKKKPDIYP